MKADFKKETCSKPQVNLKTVLEDAFDKLKGFTEKITQDNNSKKYNDISTYKKADNEEIRMRGEDL